MAEIVTGAMGTLLPKLANLIKEEYNLQKKVRGEIMFLEAALIKVSEAPIDEPPDIQVKLWTREVRELSYDLEDNIDRFMVRGGDGKPHSFKGFIDRSLHLLTRGRIKHKIGLDIKEIRIRIKDVSERRDRYKVDLVPSKKPVGRSIDNLRLSALYRKATELVGAEEKSVDLVKRLMEGDDASMKQPVVLSIVGFGGLGKTTLANLVYQKIKVQFACRAFVYVSNNPDVVKIFKDMLYQFDGDKYRDINQGTWSEEQLISELREFLQYKSLSFHERDLVGGGGGSSSSDGASKRDGFVSPPRWRAQRLHSALPPCCWPPPSTSTPPWARHCLHAAGYCASSPHRQLPAAASRPRVREPPHQVQAPHLGRTCGAPLPYSNTSCHEHTAGGCIRKTCVDRGLDRISRGLNTKLTVHIAEGRGSCYKLHGKNCCSDTLKANQKRVAAK